MVQKTKTGTTGAGCLEDNGCKSPPFICIWMFLSVVGIGFCASTNGLKGGSYSSVPATAVTESMPLWGGAASLNSFLPDAGIEETIKLHHFDQISCQSCHQASIALEGSVVSENTSWKSEVDVNRSCTSFGCHDYEPKMNHPVGVPVRPNLSGQMPLGPSSEITCLTCHDSVATETLDRSEGIEQRYLVPPDPTICQSCHEGNSNSLEQRSHWKFSGKAHLVPLTVDFVMDGTDNDPMVSRIDIESQSCLSCHDEISATVAGMNGANRRTPNAFNDMTDHPIGMDYQSVLTENAIYFNSLQPGQSHIRMFDGKVGCGSCHSLYSQTRFHLVVENDNSALCKKCHNR